MSYAGKVRINNVDSPIAAALYGVCTTQGGTAAKVVSLSSFDALITGVVIAVKFSQANTAANPTLNVNGTGDIPIYLAGNTAPGNTAAKSWASNSIVTFTYDGGNNGWFMNDAGVNSAIITMLESEVAAETTARSAAVAQVYSRIAPVYDSTATYRKNDLVIYNEQLYRCNNDITSAEAWTAAHWTATTVAAEREYKLVFIDTVAGIAPTATATPSGEFTVTVDVSVFGPKVGGVDGTYEFTYTSGDWTYNGSPIDTAQYGLTIDGTPVADDTISVVYSSGTNPFVYQNTYPEYPYRASVALPNVTNTMIPQVTYALSDAVSGMFAPVAETYNGGVYLYATGIPESGITIPTIVCWG